MVKIRNKRDPFFFDKNLHFLVYKKGCEGHEYTIGHGKGQNQMNPLFGEFQQEKTLRKIVRKARKKKKSGEILTNQHKYLT